MNKIFALLVFISVLKIATGSGYYPAAHGVGKHAGGPYHYSSKPRQYNINLTRVKMKKHKKQPVVHNNYYSYPKYEYAYDYPTYVYNEYIYKYPSYQSYPQYPPVYASGDYSTYSTPSYHHNHQAGDLSRLVDIRTHDRDGTYGQDSQDMRAYQDVYDAYKHTPVQDPDAGFKPYQGYKDVTPYPFDSRGNTVFDFDSNGFKDKSDGLRPYEQVEVNPGYERHLYTHVYTIPKNQYSHQKGDLSGLVDIRTYDQAGTYGSQDMRDHQDVHTYSKINDGHTPVQDPVDGFKPYQGYKDVTPYPYDSRGNTDFDFDSKGYKVKNGGVSPYENVEVKPNFKGHMDTHVPRDHYVGPGEAAKSNDGSSQYNGHKDINAYLHNGGHRENSHSSVPESGSDHSYKKVKVNTRSKGHPYTYTQHHPAPVIRFTEPPQMENSGNDRKDPTKDAYYFDTDFYEKDLVDLYQYHGSDFNAGYDAYSQELCELCDQVCRAYRKEYAQQ